MTCCRRAGPHFCSDTVGEAGPNDLRRQRPGGAASPVTRPRPHSWQRTACPLPGGHALATNGVQVDAVMNLCDGVLARGRIGPTSTRATSPCASTEQPGSHRIDHRAPPGYERSREEGARRSFRNSLPSAAARGLIFSFPSPVHAPQETRPDRPGMLPPRRICRSAARGLG